MKKLFLLVAVVSIALTGCGKIEDAIDKLENRLDNLEQEKIPSIDEQISAINTTLDTLDAMDKELKGYIDGLQVTADNLQKQINDTNTKIDEVKVALQGEIATAKADVLAELEAAKKELEKELETINETIETLQKEDDKLNDKIKDLRTYVDTELGETTDWVNATFATLEQYNALVSEVATIKKQIEATNQSITDLETRLTTKINDDIAAAVASLNADIQQKVKEITDGYTDAVKTAKEDITAAYTAAIQNAITSLDASLKAWVGQQLANYYTIAESEARLTTLKADLEAQLAVQKTYCESLMTALTNNTTSQIENLQRQIDAINKTIADINKEIETLYSKLGQTKTEITTAYTEAIAKAIEENEGKWSGALAKEVEALNELIEKNNIAAFDAFAEEATSRLEALEADIAIIKNNISELQENVAALLSRIQSITYVPKYSDGKADLDYNTKTVELDYQISPKSAISDLSKVWESALAVKTSYAATRAVAYENTPIVSYSADVENATVTVTVSLENLDNDFFNGYKEASMALQITDGNNFINSDYTVVYDRSNYEIRYTTSDESIITAPTFTNVMVLSNLYRDGEGVITYSVPIHKIPNSAFSGNSKLTSIELSHCITSIGNSAFSKCTSLTSVTIPNSVTSIGDSAFSGCTSLTSITIPDSVTSIGDHAFSGCSSLTSITIPDSVTSIEYYAFSGCSSLTSITIPDSVTSIGAHAFDGCTSLANVTIGNGVTSIGDYAFYDCTSLTSVTIPDSVTSIGDSAFNGCI